MGIGKIARRWAARAVDFGLSQRTRRFALIISAVVVFYGVLGYFGGSILIRRIVSGSVAKSCGRPISIERAVLNPYTLNLNLYQIQIDEPASRQSFINIARLHVKVSWTSLFHLAPIVSLLTIEQPTVHIVRIDERHFNLSDLIESTQATPAAPSTHIRFAISNIQVNDGEVRFHDRVLGQYHTITHIRIGVPFLANLPADINSYVQPLLMMVIDGSPFRIAGKAKPFSMSPESVLNLKVHRLDLSRYAAYLPRNLAIELPQGALSCALQVHFVAASPEPVIRLAGGIVLDQLNVRDGAGAPLLSLKHAWMELNEIEPLRGVAAFGAIRVDGLTTYVVRKHDGTLNFTSLTSKGSASGIRAQGARIRSSLHQSRSQVTTTLSRAASANRSPAPTSIASSAASSGPSTIAKATAALPSPVGPTPAATVQAALTPNSSMTAKATNKLPSATHSIAAAAVSTTNTPAALSASATEIHAAGRPGASPSPAASAPISSATIAPRPISTASPASVSALPAKAQTAAQTTAANVSVESVIVANSTINITDYTGAKPAKLGLEKVHLLIRDLHTMGTTPATFDMGANLSGGGSLAAKGTLDLPQSNATTDIRLDQVNVPALQAFAQSLVTADVASGQLSARVNARMNLATGHFNVDVKPATVVIDQVQIRDPGSGENPISWSKLSATIGELNLAKREAEINEIRADGLQLLVRRERNGQLSLASLMTRVLPAAQTHTTPHLNVNVQAPSMATPWQFRVDSLVLANNDIDMIDETMVQPIELTFAPLNLHLTGASGDFSKSVGLEVDGIVNRRGSFKISGNATPKPISAQLRVNTQNLDLAVANPYIASYLNTTITRALLTTNGAFSMTGQDGRMLMVYRGDCTLSNVRMVDKVTLQRFVRWGAFNARSIDFRLGQGEPRIRADALSLSNFYANLILNSNGRLNLSDIMSSPQAPPTSLVRANTGTTIAAQPPRAFPPAPTAQSRGKPAIPSKPFKADIEIGGVTLQGGHINYTDHFIRPNYSARLTKITGKVEGFGSVSTKPAKVDLRGQVSGTAPLEISGSINPLTPRAFMDITAKANGVELPNLSPYSSKYTGYPITKGTATVNVHYLLKEQELTAQNRIRLDQLTFGPRVQGKSVLNLPIRLAVALLKNPQGQINLDIPVSGSLSDPEFSIGGVILGTLKNVIYKVATSPFKLLASVAGEISRKEQLEYVEFKPGYAALSPESEEKLNTLAQALNARPALQLDISGRVDPKYDREGLHYAMLDRLIREQKIKEQADKGENVNPADVEVTQAEYDKYLKRVYKAAMFEKPRDFLGLDKSLPPDEMKKLLIAHMNVTDADLKRLADKRAAVVRRQLAKQVDPARLFIVVSKLNAERIEGKGKTTRVDLSLN